MVSIWFERKFDFSFPVHLRMNLGARLRGTPARLEEVLGGCSDSILSRRAEEKWSAQEHAGHLLDLEPLWLSRVAASDPLTPTDLSNRVTHEANHNARLLEHTFWRNSAAPGLFAQAIPHPRLKTPMCLVDHLYFVAEHDDHHLARIWELIR